MHIFPFNLEQDYGDKSVFASHNIIGLNLYFYLHRMGPNAMLGNFDSEPLASF